MSWNSKLIKGLALMATPIKLVTRGVDNVKQEIKEDITVYETKIKAMIAIGGAFILFAVFTSLAIALAINHYSQSDVLGFIVLSSIYFILFLILLWVNREKIN